MTTPDRATHRRNNLTPASPPDPKRVSDRPPVGRNSSGLIATARGICWLTHPDRTTREGQARTIERLYEDRRRMAPELHIERYLPGIDKRSPAGDTGP